MFTLRLTNTISEAHEGPAQSIRRLPLATSEPRRLTTKKEKCELETQAILIVDGRCCRATLDQGSRFAGTLCKVCVHMCAIVGIGTPMPYASETAPIRTLWPEGVSRAPKSSCRCWTSSCTEASSVSSADAEEVVPKSRASAAYPAYRNVRATSRANAIGQSG